MALSDVIKKREATGEPKEKAKKAATNILDDVRIVIAVIVLACIALIALIVYNNGQIESKLTRIDSVKASIKDNQYKIANLKALQARSGEYIAQKEAYDAMISDEQINDIDLKILIEGEVEAHNCNLVDDVIIDNMGNTGLVNQCNATIKITGSFEDIMSFCRDEISKTEIRRIDTIRMSGGNSKDIKEAEIMIVFFYK